MVRLTSSLDVELYRVLQQMTHGHVLNVGRDLARCGGPGLCSHCALERDVLALIHEYQTKGNSYGKRTAARGTVPSVPPE